MSFWRSYLVIVVAALFSAFAATQNHYRDAYLLLLLLILVALHCVSMALLAIGELIRRATDEQRAAREPS